MLALCPHCLEYRDLQEVRDPEHGPVLRCDSSRCNYPTIPLLYGEDYAAHPPVPLSLIGLPGHGKTTFIDGLIQEIQAAGRRWADAGFSYAWLDEARFRNARQRIRAFRDGSAPNGTRTVFPKPQGLRLHGVPRVGGSQLVISDAAEYVRPGSVVVWLLGLTGGPDDPHRLVADHARALERAGGRTQDQDLVLVLTRGDELQRRPDLPASARAALAQPDYCPAGPVWTALERASADLEGWLASDRCGRRELVRLVGSQFKSVRYCIVAAHGESARCGVLAPLLWLWRTSRDPAWVERCGGQDLYLDLAEAVATAGTVHLEDRVYRLDAPLNVVRPVTVVGRGADQTVLEVTAAGYGLGVRATGMVALRGLTVRRAADGPPGDLIRVLGGELDLQNVVVSGGLSGELMSRPVGGAGVVAGQHSRLTATGCTFRSNHGNGVLVIERASAELTACTAEKNGDAGVYARTAGALTLTRGVCRENHTGVWVEAASGASVTASTCEQNGECGVVLSGHVRGSVVVRGNTCAGNGRDGVHVRTAAAPTVVSNTCATNRRNGIAFTDQSAGTARGNTCETNCRHGLRVCDDAAPALEENTAEGNAGCGLFYEERAGGFARGNVCRDNRGDGIRLEGPAAPLVAENEARLNDGYGIAIVEPSSKAEVDPKGNTAADNRRGPVLDPRPKRGDSWWGRKIWPPRPAGD